MNSDVVRWPRCLWCYSCCNCCYCNDNDNDTKFVWQQRKRQSIVEQGSCNQRQSTRIASTTTNTTNMMIKRCTFVDFSDIVHSVIKSNFIFKLICVWLVINLNLITIVVGESDFAAPLADQLSSPSTSSSALSAAAAEPSSMGIERNRNSIAGHYTSTWAVHIPDGDEIMVNRIATDHGFINLGKW